LQIVTKYIQQSSDHDTILRMYSASASYSYSSTSIWVEIFSMQDILYMIYNIFYSLKDTWWAY